jgi:phospho-N-acetylmuramoyl-pentapeptide-transferase
VNLTDGLDGLATGLSIISFLAFGLISLSTGWLDGYEEIALFCFSLSGSLLGFLIFNSHPASIFMGDTGSLALGATLGAVAILTRHEIFLLIIGFVFVLETVSVIIQVSYYKLTKRRVFLMTPLHHHFEKKGYSEQKIVKLFWIIGLISTLIAILVI